MAPGTNHSFVPSHEVGLAGLIAVPATATFLDFRFRWTCPKSLWGGGGASHPGATCVVPSRAAVLGWCWYLLPRVGPQGSPCEPDGCGYNKQRRVGQSYPVWFCVWGKKKKKKKEKNGVGFGAAHVWCGSTRKRGRRRGLGRDCAETAVRWIGEAWLGVDVGCVFRFFCGLFRLFFCVWSESWLRVLAGDCG